MSMGKPLVRNAKLAGIAEPVILSQTIAQRLEKVALSVNQAGIRLKRAIAFANRALMDSGKNFLNPFHVWVSTYEALTDAQWAGRICIRSSSNIYNQSLIASMIASVGADAAETFASGLVANLAKPPGGGDTDQLKAAAAGVCDLAIANTYYFGRLMASDSAEDRAVAEQLGVFWPNQGDRGTHVNISGVALTRAAKNSVDAIALVEFMLTPEAQNWYSEVNNEYPVVSGVEPSAKLASLGAFNADALNLTLLGENNRAAVELMDRAGWKKKPR